MKRLRVPPASQVMSVSPQGIGRCGALACRRLWCGSTCRPRVSAPAGGGPVEGRHARSPPHHLQPGLRTVGVWAADAPGAASWQRGRMEGRGRPPWPQGLGWRTAISSRAWPPSPRSLAGRGAVASGVRAHGPLPRGGDLGPEGAPSPGRGRKDESRKEG